MSAISSQAPQISPIDTKIDPSIATAITTGETAPAAAAPAYSANAANGEASSGPVQAAAEKGAEAPAATTTTTTTIITTTTGPGSPDQLASPSQLTSSPTHAAGASATSPIVGGSEAGGSAIAPRGSTGAGSTVAPVALADPAHPAATTTEAAALPNGQAAPATNGTHSNLANGAAAGAAGGALAAGAVHEEEKPAPAMVLKPKEAKKYQKLLRKEAKNDEQDLAQAIKDAQNLEKPLRKANKAEKQSEKRHQNSVHDDHKAAKKFNRAKEAYEKTQAALSKALDELDIKKKHTIATQEAFDNAKKRIDQLRDQKIENDKDRARRQASLTTTS